MMFRAFKRYIRTRYRVIGSVGAFAAAKKMGVNDDQARAYADARYAMTDDDRAYEEQLRGEAEIKEALRERGINPDRYKRRIRKQVAEHLASRPKS